ncbi:MAG: hypothetical protein HETSPECPRED_010407 [Heterodermia speciosa]|uniref:PLL-like beta propeller domain-containing protein n=1 Tax=Heterodermia speciosa TaxID=116794 RepID=A0A8H3J021_9LECA|nr:MAG: hypothetical protein HETSPECPRED_010407 [Heterodermia speciosa]
MAPLVQLATQLLISLGSFDISSWRKPCQNSASPHPETRSSFISSALSTISWGYNRMDVFGTNLDTGNLSHKWFDGYQWGPSNDALEALGVFDLSSAPTAISWGANRSDIFVVGYPPNTYLYHKYWDGHQWGPHETDWENLGGDLFYYPVAATSWGVDRIDIFGIGYDKELYHKHWDGSSWRPSDDSLEALTPGVFFKTGPTAVSWGPNRNDVFGLGEDNNLLHFYWDGSQWSKTEDFGGDFSSPPTAISWGKNRLDVFAVDAENGTLSHKYWDGYQWSGYEDLGGDSLKGQVAASSWAENRLDIVALNEDGKYYYKYWDGSQWNPSATDWYAKGGNFSSVPSAVSWGKDRLDIYGVDAAYQLAHQTWYGSGWYPESDKWEQLGGLLNPN